MDTSALMWIVGAVVIMLLIVAMQNFASSYNKRKRYEAKVRAGVIKEGEEPVPETEEQKKAKMDAALKLYADLQKNGKNKE